MEYWNHSVRQSGICNDILDEKAEEIRETKTTCSVEKWLRGVDRQEFLQWREKAANPRHKCSTATPGKNLAKNPALRDAIGVHA